LTGETKTVLVIDDCSDMGELACSVFKMEGFQATLATSGQEALTLLSKIPIPNLILVDCDMPSMSGQQFLETLKTEMPAVMSKSKIVGFSGFPPGSTATQAFEALVSEFVTKPHDVDEFIGIVQRLTHSS